MKLSIITQCLQSRKQCNLIYYFYFIIINFRDGGKYYVSKCLGSKVWVHGEKGIVANCSAVREWDSNGTVFGYNAKREGHNAGEFGHNDYYPVVIAAC
jgi:hypothetical protein